MEDGPGAFSLGSAAAAGDRRLASAGQERKWEVSCLMEMFTWDFGVPDPTLLDDGSVLITFYATEMDHITHQRYVRIKID